MMIQLQNSRILILHLGFDGCDINMKIFLLFETMIVWPSQNHLYKYSLLEGTCILDISWLIEPLD